MRKFLSKNHKLIFYACWLLLALIQSGLTELQDDEAYYWVYSKFLDWGYFDHPPMIALLIKAGYAIFPNELGVRLFPALLNVLSLFIIEKLTEKKNPLLFYCIALSIAVIQVSGFIAVPDIPLIFFTALFFLCYRKFIRDYSLFSAALLGLSMALLLYSKYHAVLIIFFTLLSNPKLLLKYRAYLAVAIAFILFTPHLYWQYNHNWISFKYHLFESNVNAYKFSFTLEYLIGQILLPGPIAGFILLPAAFLYKPVNKSERALKFTMVGLYIFFLFSSFRGKVEGNWTSPALVPLIILSHQFLFDKKKWISVFAKTVPVTLILMLAGRIVMISDVLPVKKVKELYHSWNKWPQEMRTRTNDLPIVFSNSYQRASKYWFYSGQITYSQNWYRERKNNYNFWPVEDSILGKPVFFLDKYELFRFKDSLKTPLGWIGYKYDPAFLSFAKIDITTSEKKYHVNKSGNSLTLQCHFNTPEYYSHYILNHKIEEDTVKIGIFNKYRWVKDIVVPISAHDLAELSEKTFIINPGLEKGSYYMRFTIKCGYRNATQNSDKIHLVID
ncbi:MAG TPA: glycosyltransferase family 39 protein [Chitinophagaceae bacterium]|nr:glycosyltransferase family 39 protein [Chitinophagaceae bacterium]